MATRPTDSQIEQACHAWATNLSHPSSPSAFSSLYTPFGTHADHCHFYRQTGTEELEILHKVWLHAIPDCVVTVYQIDILNDTAEGNRRATIRYTGEGTFVNDLTKTKATGQRMEYKAVVDFEFDRQGKFICGDEWMSCWFYKQPIGEYRVLHETKEASPL